MRKEKNAQDYLEGDFISLNGYPLDKFARIISREEYVKSYKRVCAGCKPILENSDNIYYRTFGGEVNYQVLDSESIEMFRSPFILSLEEVKSRLKRLKKDAKKALEMLSLK